MTEQCVPHPHAVRYAERALAHDVIQKILVVVDPTARFHPCVEKAARLAMSCGSTIELFVCDADLALPDSWAGGTTSREYRDYMREQRLRTLDAMATPLRARGIHVVTECRWHVPLEEGIVSHAIHSGADIVIKDTHRHALMPHMSGAQTDWILIRQIPMPLLLVRPTEWPARPKIAVTVDPCHIADRPVALDETLLAKGSALGRALAGPLEILHALQLPPHFVDEVPASEAIKEFQAREREAVEQLADHNQVARNAVHFREGKVPEALVKLVGETGPDILVIGAIGRSRFPGSVATTASQVLEQVPADVLVVKPPGFVSPVLVTDR